MSLRTIDRVWDKIKWIKFAIHLVALSHSAPLGNANCSICGQLHPRTPCQCLQSSWQLTVCKISEKQCTLEALQWPGDCSFIVRGTEQTPCHPPHNHSVILAQYMFAIPMYTHSLHPPRAATHQMCTGARCRHHTPASIAEQSLSTCQLSSPGALSSGQPEDPDRY